MLGIAIANPLGVFLEEERRLMRLICPFELYSCGTAFYSWKATIFERQNANTIATASDRHYTRHPTNK